MGLCCSKPKGNDQGEESISRAMPDPLEDRAESTTPATAALPEQMGESSSKKERNGVTPDFLRWFMKEHINTLQADNLTTQHVCDKIVKPATATSLVPYVNLSDLPCPTSSFGTPNVFVSHAWRYEFLEVMEAMLEYAEEHPDVVFWFDLFANCQHEDGQEVRPQEWWSNRFRSSIREIGTMLLILTPWNDPVPLSRAWCLWEILCAVEEVNVELKIKLSTRQSEEFKQAVVSRGAQAVIETMVQVDAEKAEAFLQADKEMIFKCVEESPGGFQNLNSLVKDQMRAWFLKETIELAEGVMKKPLEESNDEDVQFLVSSARVASGLGHSDRSLEYSRRALQMTERSMHKLVADPDYTNHNAYFNYALCLSDVGNTMNQIGLVDEGRKTLLQAVEYLNKARDAEGDWPSDDYENLIKSTLAGTYHSLSASCHQTSEYEGVLEYATKCKQIFEELGADESTLASLTMTIAVGEHELGNFQAGYDKMTQCLKYQVANKHPDTCFTLDNMGWACFELGRYEEGLQHVTTGLNSRRETLGAEHRDTAFSHITKAQLHTASGEFDKAIEDLNQVDAGALEPFAQGYFHDVRGQARLGQGLAPAALEDLQKAIAIRASEAKIDEAGRSCLHIIPVYDALEQPNEAKNVATRALEYFAALPDSHPHKQQAREEIAQRR